MTKTTSVVYVNGPNRVSRYYKDGQIFSMVKTSDRDQSSYMSYCRSSTGNTWNVTRYHNGYHHTEPSITIEELERVFVGCIGGSLSV